MAGDATLKGFASTALNHGITSTNDVLAHFGISSWITGNSSIGIAGALINLGDGATGVVFGYRGQDWRFRSH